MAKYNPVEDLDKLNRLKMTRPDGCGYFLLNNCKKSIYVAGLSEVSEIKPRNLPALERGVYISTKQVEKYTDAQSYVSYLKFIPEADIDEVTCLHAPGESFISKELESVEKASVSNARRLDVKMHKGTAETKTLIHLSYEKYKRQDVYYEQRFGVGVKAISVIDNEGLERVEVVQYVGRYKVIAASSTLEEALAEGFITMVKTINPSKTVASESKDKDTYTDHFKTIAPIVTPEHQFSESEKMGITIGKVIRVVDSLAGYRK